MYHNTSLTLQSAYHSLPIIGSLQQNKLTIEQLKQEKAALEDMLRLEKPLVVWSSPTVSMHPIKNILWHHNEHWYLTDPCPRCVAFNARGLIGKMDPAHGEGMVKLISHKDTILVAASNQSKQLFLLQGQGYHKDMSILESDSTDYPPVVDDILVSSGLDGLYPAGIPIGKVVKKTQGYQVQLYFNRSIARDMYVIATP
jgi:hypothetical protein